jgi:DNA-binding response OmpR family regulator
LRIDLPRHEVAVGERPVDVTASEFRVLALLASSPGTVFTRRQIMEHVWGGAYFGDGHPVDTHVLNLRRKIETGPTRPRRLLTVRGVGFKLVAPPCEPVDRPDETLIGR